MDFAHDQFIRVRIIIGIVTGLAVARLLTGFARFVQHPVRDRNYLAHLAWALFLLLAIVHFWWFEFGLQRIGVSTFEIYLFVICYAALFFFPGAPSQQGALAAMPPMFVTDRRYHGAFAAVAIAAEVYWITSQFEVLD